MDQAVSLVVPLSAPVAVTAHGGTRRGGRVSTITPLSTRFDESDSLVVFDDDVQCPGSTILPLPRPALVRAQFFDTPAHGLTGDHRAERAGLVTKTKFLAGLALRIASANGVDKLPPVQTQLGELPSAAVVDGVEAAAVQRRGAACSRTVGSFIVRWG